MSIWDFKHYELNDLFKIRDACAMLEHIYGIEQDEDMKRELISELERRTDE